MNKEPLAIVGGALFLCVIAIFMGFALRDSDQNPTIICYYGVKYLQFPQNITIAVDINGKPIKC
jgi:hypothetical protein